MRIMTAHGGGKRDRGEGRRVKIWISDRVIPGRYVNSQAAIKQGERLQYADILKLYNTVNKNSSKNILLVTWRNWDKIIPRIALVWFCNFKFLIWNKIFEFY